MAHSDTKLLYALIGGVFWWFSPQIKDVSCKIYDWISKQITTSYTFKKNESIKGYSVLNYVNAELSKTAYQKIGGAEDSVPNGYYSLSYTFDDGYQTDINIEINETEIVLYKYVEFSKIYGGLLKVAHGANMKLLEKFASEVHSKTMDPSKYMVQFMLKDDGSWSKPICNPHKEIKGKTLSMNLAIDLVSQFISDNNEYEQKGINYRFGMLLYGNSGTGKSTVAQAISMQFGMNMYCINLLSDKMTDGLLIETCVTLGKRSLIVFDEFDKVYASIQNNPKSKITMAGILGAIDGTIKLPFGSIVLVIMNGNYHNVITNPLHRKALVRYGRLDKAVHFTQKYKL